MITWFKQKIFEYKYGSWSVEFNERDVIVLKSRNIVDQISWGDIERITAYKADMFTYDPIVIVLESLNKAKELSIQELWPGYKEFLSEVINRWPQIGYEWVNKVNEGAFISNYMILWENKSA